MGDECIFRHFSISWGNNYLITCTAGGKEKSAFHGNKSSWHIGNYKEYFDTLIEVTIDNKK